MMGSHLGLVYHPEIIACSIVDYNVRTLKYTAKPRGSLHKDLPHATAPWYVSSVAVLTPFFAYAHVSALGASPCLPGKSVLVFNLLA